jgi:hypothetical protein
MKMVWQVTDCVDKRADDVRGSVDFWAGDGDVVFDLPSAIPVIAANSRRCK